MDQPGFGIGWKNDKRLTDLDFADDIALVAEQAHVCQQMTTNLAVHSIKFGLHISLEKTKIIHAMQAAIPQPIYQDKPSWSVWINSLTSAASYRRTEMSRKK